MQFRRPKKRGKLHLLLDSNTTGDQLIVYLKVSADNDFLRFVKHIDYHSFKLVMKIIFISERGRSIRDRRKGFLHLNILSCNHDCAVLH